MASLDILCSNPLNLKNKITKIEHKKIFCGSSKILKNISWPINICLKYFMTPTKTLSCHVFPSSSLCYSICSYIISSRPAFNLSSLLLCPLNSLSHSLNQFDIRRFPSGLLLLQTYSSTLFTLSSRSFCVNSILLIQFIC